MRSDRILPSEDAADYARRLAGWRAAVQPGNQIVADLVDRAFFSLWKLERGDRREMTLALEAMDDAQEGTKKKDLAELERLKREMLAAPGPTYDLLRQTRVGTVSLHDTWSEVKQVVDNGGDLTVVEAEYLLALEGFSTTDLIRGQPRAVTLFLAIFAAQYGNNPENRDYVARVLRRNERDKLLAARAPERAAKLIAAMPDQATGRARLKKLVDEILAELERHFETVFRKSERRRASALKKAEINLEEEGKRLVSYMKTCDASMHACLRRIAAMQKADAAGTGPPGPGGGKRPGAGRRAAPPPGDAGQGVQHPAPTSGSDTNGPDAPAGSDRGVETAPPQPPAAESTGTEGVTSASAPETPATDAVVSYSPGGGSVVTCPIESIDRDPAADAEDAPRSAPENPPSTSTAAAPTDTAAASIFTNEAKTAEAGESERVTVVFEGPDQGSRGACGGSPDRGALDSATVAPARGVSGSAANADSERSPPAGAPTTGEETGSNFPRPP
jgi:hypothetical protein